METLGFALAAVAVIITIFVVFIGMLRFGFESGQGIGGVVSSITIFLVVGIIAVVGICALDEDGQRQFSDHQHCVICEQKKESCCECGKYTYQAQSDQSQDVSQSDCSCESTSLSRNSAQKN